MFLLVHLVTISVDVAIVAVTSETLCIYTLVSEIIIIIIIRNQLKKYTKIMTYPEVGVKLIN